MNVILFGATGMVGHGVLNAALADERVTRVLSVGRRPTGREHPRLEELQVDDLFNLSAVAEELSGFDACVYAIGVTSAGTNESDYRRMTLDLAVAIAEVLVRHNPEMTFVFVSGAGTNADSRQMWARVKGETENALAAMPFAAVYSARPGFIQPVGGAVSRTTLYRVLYAVTAPLSPLLRRLFPNALIDSDELGRALLEAGLAGAPKKVLEIRDLKTLAK